VKYTLLMAALILVPAVSGQEQDAEGIGVRLETTAVSRYLWRGWVLNESASLQPALTVSYQGLSVTSWSNLSHHVPHNQAWTEHDLNLEYNRKAGSFVFTGGLYEYRYPDLRPSEGNRSMEVYAGVRHDSYFSPSFRAYHDWKLGKGDYFTGSISHTYLWKSKIGITPLLLVGLNHHQFQRNSTISDVDAGVTVDLPVGKHFVVSPFFLEMAGHRTFFGHHFAFGVKSAYSR
jgi:hypothetical protein